MGGIFINGRLLLMNGSYWRMGGTSSPTPENWFRKPYIVRTLCITSSNSLSITLCNAVAKLPIERSEKGDARSRWASFVNNKHASPFKIYQLFKRRSDLRCESTFFLKKKKIRVIESLIAELEILLINIDLQELKKFISI